ncbi:2-dehydropantoate 2-reductase [Erysiphe necator]|uniref:Putative 2-dehydropantoate 2-reductase n=1 Tax=Uncinula necator TaxID=52586 RepID=A0A0B1P7X9_UNCNE|nr:2-dehydropantoate 2-reductase [Erysiphe necator]KHJ33066.1 putative 2-dehydropantoate 2-reductase [Erysiphe necator]
MRSKYALGNLSKKALKLSKREKVQSIIKSYLSTKTNLRRKTSSFCFSSPVVEKEPPQTSVQIGEDSVISQSSRKLQSERIHIIGMGPTGQYLAHNISQLDHAPPITLLMHRPFMVQDWYNEGAAIQILRNNKISTQTGFDIEPSVSFNRPSPFKRYHKNGCVGDVELAKEPSDNVIDSLIVATACSVTIPALEPIQHRIKPTTTVCIIEKGMGIVYKLNKLFFTDVKMRPTYILGNLNHQLEPTENLFTHIERGPAELFCSKLPRHYVSVLDSGTVVERTDFSWPPEAKHLIGTLSRVPELNTETLGHKDFHMKQLYNLAICTVIESLAVTFDCANGQLLYNYGVSNLMRLILEEIYLIVSSLPELRNIKGVDAVFSPESLEKTIIGHLHRSAVTVSPMLVDLRAGKRTAIDFYTGYFVERANMLEIPCPINQMMYNLVRGKQTMRRRENDNHIPFTKYVKR